MKPFEHHLSLYEKKMDQSSKKNGARVMKGAEPSEFGHKVTSTQQVLGIDVHNVHTLLVCSSQVRMKPNHILCIDIVINDLSNVHGIHLSDPNP